MVIIVIYLSIQKKLLNLKQKILKLCHIHSCLGDISKDFDFSYMRTTGMGGCIYDFNVDYNAVCK